MTHALEPDLEAGSLDSATMHDLFTLAVRLYTHQMYPQSARVMQFLLRHDPARPHYHRALGKAFHAQGQHEQALQAYARAVKLGMPDADVHFYIGQCLIFMRRYDLAAQALERCMALARSGPQAGDALLQRARMLFDRVQVMASRAARAVNPPVLSKETR
jgi:Tfp pilus assembly protein PilF